MKHISTNVTTLRSSQLRVEGLPTLIFVRGGQEVYRLEGMPNEPSALEALVEQHLGVAL